MSTRLAQAARHWSASCVTITILAASGCGRHEVLITASPQETYLVQIDKRWSMGSVVLDMDVTRRGVPLLDAAPIDARDTWQDFEQKYPAHQWIQESILQLGHGNITPENREGTLTVANRTKQPISYLVVSAGSELFIFLELPAAAEVSISFHVQRDLEWIAARGTTEPSKRGFFNGKNFVTSESTSSSARFSVVITADGAIVSSPDVLEWRPAA